FMSVALSDRAPFREVRGIEKMLDEPGREMHGSWGNQIEAEDAFARMGADVMRWQFCAQPPDQDLLFGYGPGHEIKRRLLTLWNSVSFFVEYANIQGFRPDYSDLSTGVPGELHPLDRWLHARTRRLVELGRRARAEVGIKLRQPLRRAYVRGAGLARRHADEIRDELRVKEIGFDEGPLARPTLLPNLPVLGPRLGSRVNDVRAAL